VKSAISLEGTTPASFVPAPLLAGMEQLGDLLLEQNQPEQALAAYEASLQFAKIVSIASLVPDELQELARLLVRRLKTYYASTF